jgi:EXLDI family protein
VPNKTIYVSDDDLPLFQRAQELAGSLSAAIVAALRRYVEMEEGRREGFDEVIVRVGKGARRKVRFSGVLLGEWGRTSGSSGRVEMYRVYRSRTDKFVLHVDRSPEWTTGGQSENWLKDLTDWRTWRQYLGIDEHSWGFVKGESTLDVFDSLDALREKIPPEFYDMIAGMAEEPAVEDLDI